MFATAAEPTCFGIAHLAQRPDHVVGGERRAVVPLDARAELDLPDGRGLVRRPRERETRRLREVRVHAHERVVEVVGARGVDERRAAAGVERLALAAADVARRAGGRRASASPRAATPGRPPCASRSPPAPAAPASRAALRDIDISPQPASSRPCPSVLMVPLRDCQRANPRRQTYDGSTRAGHPSPTRVRAAPSMTLPYLGRTASLSDQVVDVLAEHVLAGTWPAGHRIPSEPELTEMFGVSRTVVRDAVRTLAARGLVEVRQGSGTVVRGEPEEPYAEALLDLLVRSDVTLADLAQAREADRPDARGARRAASAATTTSTVCGPPTPSCARRRRPTDWASAERAHLRFHVVLVESVHLPGLEILLRPLQRIIVDTSLPPDPTAPESWEVDVARADRRGDRAARPGGGGRGDAPPLRALRGRRLHRPALAARARHAARARARAPAQRIALSAPRLAQPPSRCECSVGSNIHSVQACGLPWRITRAPQRRQTPP